MTFPPLDPNVEAALHECGRERIFHRSGTPRPGVAIRCDHIEVRPPEGTKPIIVGEGETYNEAAREAMRVYVGRLRDAARNITAWADRIEATLEGKKAT
jgi:hypothetical protein